VLHHTGCGDGGEGDKTCTCFERAWTSVLGNMKKRFDSGPQDGAEWLRRLETWRAEAAKKAAAPT